MTQKKIIDILLADDDSEDRMLIMDALQESRLSNNIFCVENGEELLNFLQNKGVFSDPEKYPLPGIILLDLNMPKMDGREALKEIKADTRLCSIPIIVITKSNTDEYILKTYSLSVI